MGMVSSEGKAKTDIARKGDRRCCSGNVFCGNVLVLIMRCERCSEQSGRKYFRLVAEMLLERIFLYGDIQHQFSINSNE